MELIYTVAVIDYFEASHHEARKICFLLHAHSLPDWILIGLAISEIGVVVPL